MPRAPRPLSVLALLLALFAQVLLATAARGLVVCEELDGRVAFEWALAECCPPQPAGGEGWRAGDDCAACSDAPVDVTLARDDAARSLDVHLTPAPTPAALPTPRLVVRARPSTRGPSPAGPPPRSAPLRC